MSVIERRQQSFQVRHGGTDDQYMEYLVGAAQDIELAWSESLRDPGSIDTRGQDI